MYEFRVNGILRQTEEDMSVLDYLRDRLDLTSVKNGCGEGACGACMILVDGKKMRACLLTTAKANGKSLLTVEGLTDKEKQICKIFIRHKFKSHRG